MSDLTQQFQNARSDESLVLLEGFHAIKHALRFGAKFLQCAAREGSEFAALAEQLAPDIKEKLTGQTYIVSETEFIQLSAHPPETGIIAIARKPEYSFASMRGARPIILLDDPSHPGNIGAVIRVCAAADCAGVVVLGELDPWSPAVVRGAAGLQFALPVVRLSGFPETDRSVIAFDERGDELDESFDSSNTLLVFGSERRGISDTIKKRADRIVRIPMKEGVSSLNLATSVAVGVYR